MASRWRRATAGPSPLQPPRALRRRSPSRARSIFATDVLTTVKPTATFSKAMDPATLGTTTFTVKQGATSVSGSVTLDGTTNIATFTPAAAIENGLLYTATITTGAKDSGGLAMAANHSWTFTTAAAAGPPTVTSSTPLNLAIHVSMNNKPTATFSKAMDPDDDQHDDVHGEAGVVAGLGRSDLRCVDPHRDLRPGRSAGARPGLHGHDHHRRQGPGRHRPRWGSRLELHDGRLRPVAGRPGGCR